MAAACAQLFAVGLVASSLPRLYAYVLIRVRSSCTFSRRQFPVSIIGYFMFPGKGISTQQWEFIVVNIIGGFIYSYAKIRVSAFASTERVHAVSGFFFLWERDRVPSSRDVSLAGCRPEG